jgi:hypothetical protein
VAGSLGGMIAAVTVALHHLVPPCKRHCNKPDKSCAT